MLSNIEFYGVSNAPLTDKKKIKISRLKKKKQFLFCIKTQ